MNKAVSIDHAVGLLNEALLADPKAMKALLNHREPCNGMLASHPTIQVNCSVSDQPKVGILGIINGIFGTVSGGKFDGYGFITAIFDENGELICFKRIDEAINDIENAQLEEKHEN